MLAVTKMSSTLDLANENWKIILEASSMALCGLDESCTIEFKKDRASLIFWSIIKDRWSVLYREPLGVSFIAWYIYSKELMRIDSGKPCCFILLSSLISFKRLITNFMPPCRPTYNLWLELSILLVSLAKKPLRYSKKLIFCINLEWKLMHTFSDPRWLFSIKSAYKMTNFFF